MFRRGYKLDPAEIVKHFKILVMRFSARVSWPTVVLTKAVGLFVRMGSVMDNQHGFRHEAPSLNAAA